MKLMTGNQIIAQAAFDSGASLMFGYPITPSSEIITYFQKIKGAKFIQTEDEISAGFNTLGAVVAGKVTFTASAGVGHVLMQDPLSMAEAMRMPFVLIAMQRGGPSTGQVSYSQQEVNLATHGGNGEGLRIVYSPATATELYYYTYLTFLNAWKYRFPAILLGDGYLAKAQTSIKNLDKNVRKLVVKPLLEIGKIKNLRNCYGTEEEMAEVLNEDIEEYSQVRKEIELYQSKNMAGAKLVIVSHGIVSEAVKTALKILDSNGRKKIGFFRPVTLRPFPANAFIRLISPKQKVMVIESSNGQLAKILQSEVNGQKIDYRFYKPALGITPEEIIKKISQITD